MKVNFQYVIVLILLFAACNNAKYEQQIDISGNTKTVRRFGSVTGVKRDRIDDYRKMHAAVWPGVLKKIKECNIQNYSIYLQKIDTGYYLFSYFEYAGADFEADMKKMAMDSTTRRWWKDTDPTQLPLPEAAAKNQVWTEMEEVFHNN